MLKQGNVNNFINNLFKHTWLGTLCSMSTFTIYMKQIYFPGGGSFLTGTCIFLLNDFCIDVVPKNSWEIGEVKLWLFFLAF